MRILTICLAVISFFTIAVSATEYTAPRAPDEVQSLMPESRSFSEGFWEMVQKALDYVIPDFRNAVKTGISVISVVVIISLAQSLGSGPDDIYEIAGVIAISVLMIFSTNSMIRLGTETVTDISAYGKLLLPVLAAALAAQGGIATSTSLYAGTALFNTILNTFLTNLLKPMVYCYLALSIAMASTGEGVLKHMRDLIKTFSSWALKIILTVFTTYMSITGVISGTTDAAALKATKVTISSFVPVVGSILSDASEAVLLSAGLAKNAAGIYGIFAVLAIFLVPFLRIGIHYLVLKATFLISSVFGTRRIGELIGDFSSALGLLLAATGSSCLIQLVSTVCFLKGVG